MPEQVIVASGLRKGFKARGKAVEAVRGVDFSVHKGEIIGLLGRTAPERRPPCAC